MATSESLFDEFLRNFKYQRLQQLEVYNIWIKLLEDNQVQDVINSMTAIRDQLRLHIAETS